MKENVVKFLSCFFLILFTNKISAQSSWSEWETTNCYKGLDFSVKKGGYDEYSKKTEWYVKFRNRYYNDISFSYVLKESHVNEATTTSRETIEAQSEGTSNFFFVFDDRNVNVFVNKLRFGLDEGPYSPCDH